MKKESCYFFATISKSFKTDGTVIIKNSNGLKDIKIEEPLFIEFNKILVPFFIEEFEYRNDISALVKFETINSEEQTIDYIGKEIYAQKPKQEDSSFEFDVLLGYMVYDQTDNLIGEIIDFHDIPGNFLLIIKTSEKEVYIPFHEDFVVSIDEKTKSLVLNLPDGLTNIDLI